jgi:hypothetical protein
MSCHVANERRVVLRKQTALAPDNIQVSCRVSSKGKAQDSKQIVNVRVMVALSALLSARKVTEHAGEHEK